MEGMENGQHARLGWALLYDARLLHPRTLLLHVLPRQLRNSDIGLYEGQPYTIASMVSLYDSGSVGQSCKSVSVQEYHSGMDYAKVVSDNLGVDLVWAPVETNKFMRDMAQALIAMGLDFIPVVGPMLSVGFSIAASAITSPDDFDYTTLLGIPGASVDLIDGVKDSCKKAGKFVPKGFVKKQGESEAAPMKTQGQEEPEEGQHDGTITNPAKYGILGPAEPGTRATIIDAVKAKAERAGLDPEAPLQNGATSTAALAGAAPATTTDNPTAALATLKQGLRALSGSDGK